MYKLYWIHYEEHTDPLVDGYVGITKNFDDRIKSHKTNKKHKHIKNRLDSGAIVKILAEGLTKEEAEKLEFNYRPKENIGWNLAVGGNIPPSRKGKISPKVLLLGHERTDKQKLAAKNHSERMQGRKPSNTTPVILFGVEFTSVRHALSELKLSTFQYYFYINNKDLDFKSVEELKSYIWEERNKKLSQSRKKQ